MIDPAETEGSSQFCISTPERGDLVLLEALNLETVAAILADQDH